MYYEVLTNGCHLTYEKPLRNEILMHGWKLKKTIYLCKYTIKYTILLLLSYIQYIIVV